MTDEQEQLTTRRSMIGGAGTILGTWLLASSSTPVNAQVAKVNSTEPIDVKKFGASGKRTDNATRAFRDALEEAASRGGGTVNVPPGEYTVGTIRLKDNVTLNIGAGLFRRRSNNDLCRKC